VSLEQENKEADFKPVVQVPSVQRVSFATTETVETIKIIALAKTAGTDLSYETFNMNWQVYDDVLEDYSFWETWTVYGSYDGTAMCNAINSSLGWFKCKATREWMHDNGSASLVAKDTKDGAKAVQWLPSGIIPDA
jgi:hypothetical protein